MLRVRRVPGVVCWGAAARPDLVAASARARDPTMSLSFTCAVGFGCLKQ